MTSGPGRKNPYVGPAAFKYGQSLYGRPREVSELLDLLIVERIVTLYSPSGAGKTSLINAGLIPALETARFDVLPVIRVGKEFRSGDPDVENANRYVLSALVSLNEKNDAENAIPLNELATMTLPEYVEQIPKKTDARLNRAFIFDQFEEILTADPTDQTEKREFFTQLGIMLRSYENWVLFSMREEHFAGLQPYLHLIPTGLSTTYRLELLGPVEAEESIRTPASDAGVDFKENAAKQLVDDLREVKIRRADGTTAERLGPYIEPLQLQVVCESLWDALPSTAKEITTKDLKELGDVNQALQQYYEHALRATTDVAAVKINDLRRWFNEYLITPGGTRGVAYRDKDLTGRGGQGIPNAAVDELEKKHIIRAEVRAGGERWYELTHDRFLGPVNEANEEWREWERGQGWRRKMLIRGAALASVLAFLAIVAGSLAFREGREFDRTSGQISAYIERKNLNPDAELTAPSVVLDNVAGYMWQKETTLLDQITTFVFRKEQASNIENLADILKSADKIISEYYGIDSSVSLVMPEVTSNKSWPVTVKFNPRRNLDNGMIQYQWRQIALKMATDWGIPAPTSLKLVLDENLPVDEIKIVTLPELASNDELAQSEGSVRIPSLPGFVLVSEAELDDRLVPWFNKRNVAWQEVETLEHSGPWWLVPKWTAPLFKAAGNPTAPREAAVAVAVANKMLDQPQLVLNRQNVTYLLDELQLVLNGPNVTNLLDEQKNKESLSTVAEALSARGGINTLVHDLREVIRQDYPLTRLRYLLDALGTFPSPEYSSSEAAWRSIDQQTFSGAPVLTRLLGRWRETGRETTKYSLKDEDKLAYRDSVAWLNYEPPVRVYIGDDLVNQFVDDGKLHSYVSENLVDLRGKVYKKFGIVPPSVKFKEAETDLKPNAIRIEILNQHEDDVDAQPIAVDSINTTRDVFRKELQDRYLVLRGWWIDTEYVNERLEELPDELKQWLLARYSLTDIKSLLRSVVARRDEESAVSGEGGLPTDLATASQGQSLREFPWLMASMPFWVHASDRYDTQTLANHLQILQSARLSSEKSDLVQDRISKNVKQGAAALDKQNIFLAEKHFKNAIKLDKLQAITTFIQLYSRQPQVVFAGKLKKFRADCALTPPGKLNEERSISLVLRYEIEDFLARQEKLISSADARTLEFCLLEHYVVNDYRQHATKLLTKFLADENKTHLSATENYSLAFWLLEREGETVLKPADFHRIEDLLVRAFKNWKKETVAESAYRELITRYSNSRPPPWYLSLAEKIAEIRPNNFWIALDLGFALGNGRSVKDGKNAVVWLEKAEQYLSHPDIPTKDQPRLRAWIQYYTAVAYLTQASQGERPDRRARVDSAIRMLLEQVRQLEEIGDIPKEQLPYKEVYSSLITAYRMVDDKEKARSTLREALVIFKNSNYFTEDKFALSLNTDDADQAVRLAQRALDDRSMDQKDAFYLLALSKLLTEHQDAAYAARQFLATDHSYRDYIRLILYWWLSKNGKDDQAKALLKERWQGINPETWDRRLKNGDPMVWREMLVGYYLGELEREVIFNPIDSRENFRKSLISKLGVEGLSYDGMRCEAHFYDALLQEVSGDFATRSRRYEESLKKAVEYGYDNFYEKVMAQYLLDKLIEEVKIHEKEYKAS